MKFVSMTSLFKTGVLLLPFAFAACTSDDSSSWLDRPESFGEVVYNRHLARGTSAAFDCKVYSRDNHLTMEMEFDVKMYESTMNTVFDFEVGDPSVFYVDVLLSGMFEASSDDVCSDVKDMDENMQTSCSDSHVKGKVEMVSVADVRASSVLSTMKSNFEEQCDGFYDYYKDAMSDMPGKWIYHENANADPAQSCNVRLDGDTLYVDAVFASKSFSSKTYRLMIDGMSTGYFQVNETFDGVDPETFNNICSAHSQQSQVGNVSCLNSGISYMMYQIQNGEIVALEDLAVAAKTELCAGFLDGSLSLEDAWYDK